MRIAAHGFISDSGGSSAGAVRVLLRTLLEQGHEVHFYGVRGFTEPKSLESYEKYRYFSMSVPWITAGNRVIERLNSRYPASLHSVLSHVGMQREAVVRMESSGYDYDFVFCIDTLNLWPSRLPVLSWPQSPPQTEWAALRTRKIASMVVKHDGLGYYTAVQAFYAYRWSLARWALRTSDLILCGSPWAHEGWLAFGIDPAQIQLQPYPIEIEDFRTIAPPRVDSTGAVTFLWLGRAVPRKRLDLFLEGFRLLRARHPSVQAKIVGNLRAERAAAALLDRYRGQPGLSEIPAIARSEVPGLFGSCHVLVQPSQNENFGFGVAEALAAGRPVVTGPTNGTGWYGHELRFLFDSYDPESVAAAMERARAAVLADPEGVAAKARRFARQHFEPAAVAKQITLHAEATIERLRSRQEPRSPAAARS